MPPPDRAAWPLLVTSPGPDISRHRLKQFTSWIRDELDVLVAREGPNVLHPDDVVTLHDLFVALRHSTTITALDLRATGIHKAVMAIAGVATRWPRRLCDDSDKIIALWTTKFGPLEELYPFLYGRRGRLESIASQVDYSPEALLKRWSLQCAEKIDPKVSHRQGSLGFTAGDWWVSPLFAHHAGIIGAESIEGGTTYDKDAAYALVLKDVSEVDARDEDSFIHRFPNNDKGKFRLTSATAKSRSPIRVLRNHSVNGTWGPKAGIRYEGLYVVKGWCVRQAKLDDTLSGKWKAGDILYEVSMRRHDPVPMSEVTRRPTSGEVDDYLEYKRLRKLHRENNREGSGFPPLMPDTDRVLPCHQAPVSPTVPPQSLLRISPGISRTNTFKELTFDALKTTPDSKHSPSTHVISPMTLPDQQDSFFTPKMAEYSYFIKEETISAASSPNRASHADNLTDKHVRNSRASVTRSITRSITDQLKEIIPWHELELEEDLSTPITSNVAHAKG
ncbi:hypothetical protein SVAN01_07388 [Stagonosporopsis vannaccii]|nr:hypothetical protein SVAN01_07388 [Stagonosporopsis vannaccii]